MVDQVLQVNYGSNRSGGLVAIALLTSGLVGGLTLAPAAIGQEVIGQGSLIAQEIVDGLPPPPNVGQNNVGQTTLPVLPQPQQVQPQGATVAVPDQAGGDRQYLVMIDGDSPRLLKQVQRVASSASVQDYQGQRMIVAAFEDSDRAQRQVQMLTSRGISARMIRADQVASAASPFDLSATPTSSTVPVQQSAMPMAVAPDLPPADLMPNSAAPTVQVPSQAPSQALRAAPNGAPREVNFGGQVDQSPSPPSFPAPADATRSTSPSSDSSGRGYYVVVPGKQEDLDAISNQIIRLGDGFGIAQLVQQSNTRGTHLQVGPFSDRQAANRWNHYFRDFGIDARVTLGR